jgi:hypothetical protein
MHVKICRAISALSVICALSAISCGKSGEEKKKTDQTTEQADSVLSVAISKAPFKDVLAQAGFEITGVKVFPTTEARKSGQVVLYRSRKGHSGGILYFRNDLQRAFPTWHWYFDDKVPVDISAVELNEDGMWDVRISMEDGSTREYQQDEEFTLFAEPRSDWIALNGRSSPATDPDHSMWHCFDGMANTFWRSSLKASGEVFLEFWAPFGIQRGILTVQTTDEGRPRECELYIDGKRVKQFTLEDRTGEQKVQVGSTGRNPMEIRFVVRSSYAKDGIVAITGLKLE